MPPLPTISIVVPMYNEELLIEHSVACILRTLQKHEFDFELLLVDDASTDRTRDLVAPFVASDPRVRLLARTLNGKLGRTLRTGFAAAVKDLVLYMDADLPFDPEEIPRVVRALTVSRADIVAGYRLDRTTEGARRTVYSLAYNLLIGALFGWPHRDINFSCKLMRREVLEAVELRAEGSLIDAELVVKARNLGFVIQQIGINYLSRVGSQSRLSSPAVIGRILVELVRLYPEMRRPRRRTATL